MQHWFNGSWVTLVYMILSYYHLLIEQIDTEIDKKDLKIEATRASGPGGQNVNCLSTAVRITHLPTGKHPHSDGRQFVNPLPLNVF